MNVNSFKTFWFWKLLVARYIKINVVDLDKSRACMKVELVGCPIYSKCYSMFKLKGNKEIILKHLIKSNQRNPGSSGNQNNTYKVTKANEQLGLYTKLGTWTSCTSRVRILCFSRNTRRVKSRLEKRGKENYDTLNKLVFMPQLDTSLRSTSSW